jgi:hypothetical protein
MWQLAMASMAGMDTGPQGQPVDLTQLQGKFKVSLSKLNNQLCVELVHYEVLEICGLRKPIPWGSSVFFFHFLDIEIVIKFNQKN